MNALHKLWHRMWRRNDSESGQILGVIGFILVASMFAGISATTAAAQLNRTNNSVDDIAVEQRSDAAVADALARLSADENVPTTRATGLIECQSVTGRSACYQYWALPQPGNATDPSRYELIINVWIDKDRDELPPGDVESIRAMSVTLESISYQTAAPNAPVTSNGRIVYQATPKSLFGNALHGFESTLLNGPDVRVTEYNSVTGETTPNAATTSSSGWVMYGSDVQTGRTVLYGREAESGGVTTSRCTGDPCESSDVIAVEHSYARATDESMEWIDGLACTTTIDGDWIASERNARIADSVLCIDGSMIIDSPTTVTVATGATVVVRGNIVVNDSLNAPASGLALPNKLFIYSAGKSVSFAPQGASDSIGVSAMMWSPLAACTTDTGSSNKAIAYYGSLVCDTVSIGEKWTHTFDSAATANYQDPVPNAKKAWSVGAFKNIDNSVRYDEPAGWAAGACVLPLPTNAASYWKLSEPSGLLANEVISGRNGGWKSASGGRGTGICGTGAVLASGGQVSASENIRSTVNGVTLEWWGANTVGDPMESAGVKVSVDTTGHISVTAGGETARFPFTVQNTIKQHLYTVTVSPTGQAKLFIDGNHKKTVKVGAPNTGGPTVLASGERGVINDAVVYTRELSTTDVEARWTTWNTAGITFEPSDAGTPFSAPLDVRANGTTDTVLKMAWSKPTGTFPDGETTYSVMRADAQDGPYASIGTIADGTLNFSLDNPDKGVYWYQVCALYNGDTVCSEPLEVSTLPAPETPDLRFTSSTIDSAVFGWDAAQFATKYEYRVRVDGGEWKPVVDAELTRSVTLSDLGANKRVDMQIRVTNDQGVSPWSPTVTGYTKPSVPTVSIAHASISSLTFEWTAVPAIIKYQYQIRTNDGAWSDVTDFGTSLRHTVSGLDANNTVDVRVRAVNPSGEGAWSADVRGITLPTSPKIIVKSVGDGFVEFEWTATRNASGYNFQYRVDSGQWSEGTRVTELSHVIGGLYKDYVVEMRVQAVNAGGLSPWSDEAMGMTNPSTPVVEAVSSTGSEATFSWGAIKNVSYYDYRYRVNSGDWSSPIGLDEAVEHTIGRLQGNAFIEFQLRATNVSATSPWSNAASIYTHPSPPAPEFVGSTVDSANFEWEPVDNATGYEYQIRLNDGSWSETQDAALALTASALDVDLNSKIEIQARTVNPAGTSSWSEPAVGFTVPTTSDPEFTTSTGSTATFTWPAVNHATEYRAQYKLADDDEWTPVSEDITATSYMVKDLEPNSLLAFRIATVNPAGVSEWSNIANGATVPTAPEVTALDFTEDSVSFEWNEIPNATSYEYRYRTNDGEWESTVDTDADLSVVIGELSVNTKVTIQVRTVNVAGVSDWSAEVSHFTSPTMSAVSFSTGTSVSATFTWPAVPHAVRYDVMYQIEGSDEWSEVMESEGTSFTVPGMPSDSKVVVQVRVANPVAESEWSEEVEGFNAPSAPEVKVSGFTEESLSFEWDGVRNVPSYEYQYAVNNTEEWSEVALTEEDSLTFVELADLTEATPVTFRVRSLNAGMRSDWGIVSTQTNAQPPVVTLEEVTPSNDITFSWTTNSRFVESFEYRYQIKPAEGAEDNWVVVGVDPDVREATISGFSNGVIVQIQARSFGVMGASGWSDLVEAYTAPSTPALTISDRADTSLSYAWTESMGAIGYEYQWRINDEEWFDYDRVELLEHTLGELPGDSRIQFRVRAANETAQSDWSNVVTEYTLPSIPSVLASDWTDSSVTWSWEAVANAVRYEYRYRLVGATDWTQADTTETSFIIENLAQNVQYEFQARTVNPRAASEWSDLVVNSTTPLPPVVTLTSVPTTADTISFEWTAVSGAESYNYQLSVDGGEWGEGVTVDPTQRTVVIPDLDTNKKISIRVNTVGLGGVSMWSETVTGYTLLTVPVLTSQIADLTFDWVAIPNASYQYQLRTNGGEWGETVDIDTNTFTQSTLGDDTLSEMRVRATNPGSTSGWSDTKPVIRIPSTLTAEFVSSTSTTATYRWTGIDNVSSYTIEHRVDGGQWASATATPSGTSAITWTSPATTADKKVEFRVHGINIAGNGQWSNVAVGYTQPSTPVVTADIPALTFNWAAISNITRYEYETRTNGGAWTATANLTNPTFTMTLGDNTLGEIRVRAVNPSGTSPWSNVPAVIKTPTTLVVTKTTATATSTTYTWPTLPNATKYEYRVRVDGGEWGSAITSAAPSGTLVTQTVSSLDANQKVDVQARAVNIAGNGEWSSATANHTLPSAPVVTADIPALTFNWAAISNITRYEYETRTNGGAWTATANLTNPTFTMTLGDNTLGEIRVRAVNPSGTSPWSNVPAVIKTPTTLVVTPTGATGDSATYQWSVIPNATKYEYRYRVDGGQWSQVADSVAPASGTVTQVVSGVSENQVVEIQARAVNIAGGGVWASASKLTMPSAPVVTADIPSLSFTWPAIANSTRFEYEARTDGGEWSTTTSANFTTRTVTMSLDDNSLGEIRVRTVNATGTSPWSNVPAVIKFPTSVTVTPTTSTANSATFTWGTLPHVTGFEYRVRVNDGQWSTQAATTAQTLTVPDLSRDNKVDIQVRAVNIAGPGNWSSVADHYTQPSVPTDLVSNAPAGTVAWTVVPYATAYEYQTRNDGGAWIETIRSSSAVPVNVSSLLSGDALTNLRVRTVNPAGTSDWSAVSPDIIGLPAALVVTKTTFSDDSVGFEWPTALHATKYEYQTRINGGAWSATGTASSITGTTVSQVISGLALDQRIDIQARAVNAAGNGPWSSAVANYTLPSAPAVTGDNPTLTFTWPAKNNATKYEYQTRINGGAWEAVTENTSRSVVIESLNNGQGAEIRVRTVNPSGTSDWSAIAEVVRVPNAPAPEITLGSGDEVGVSWADVPFAASYEYRTRINGGAWSQFTPTNDSEFSLTAGNDTLIEVEVYAINLAGRSAAGVATKVTMPSTPTSVQWNRSSLLLSWNPVARSTHYIVKYRTSSTGEYTALTLTSTSHTMPFSASNDYMDVTIESVNASGNSAPVETGLTRATLTAPRLTALNGATQSSASFVSTVRYRTDELQYRSSTDGGLTWNEATPVVPSASAATTSAAVTLDADTSAIVDARVKMTDINGSNWSAWGRVAVHTLPKTPAPTISFSGDAGLNFVWDRQNTVTQYVLTVTPSGGGAAKTVTTTGAVTNAVVTGLTANTAYNVTITATNPAGVSTWTGITGTKPPRPAPAEQLSVLLTDGSSGKQLVIGLTDAFTGGVSGMDVEVSYNEGAAWSSIASLDSNAVTANTYFELGADWDRKLLVRYRLTSSAGAGDWSDTSEFWTQPSKVNPTLVADGVVENFVHAWEWPGTMNTGTVDYQVQYITSPSDAWTTVPITTTLDQFWTGDLGAFSQIRVRAINPMWDSGWVVSAPHGSPNPTVNTTAHSSNYVVFRHASNARADVQAYEEFRYATRDGADGTLSEWSAWTSRTTAAYELTSTTTKSPSHGVRQFVSIQTRFKTDAGLSNEVIRTASGVTTPLPGTIASNLSMSSSSTVGFTVSAGAELARYADDGYMRHYVGVRELTGNGVFTGNYQAFSAGFSTPLDGSLYAGNRPDTELMISTRTYGSSINSAGALSSVHGSVLSEEVSTYSGPDSPSEVQWVGAEGTALIWDIHGTGPAYQIALPAKNTINSSQSDYLNAPTKANLAYSSSPSSYIRVGHSVADRQDIGVRAVSARGAYSSFKTKLNAFARHDTYTVDVPVRNASAISISYPAFKWSTVSWVQHSVNGGAWSAFRTYSSTMGETPTHTDALTGLAANTKVEFHTQRGGSGIDSRGVEPVTNQHVYITVYTNATAPTGLSLSARTTTAITVKWNAVANASSYQLRWRKSGTTTWSSMANLTGLNRQITGLTTKTTYEFQMRTVNPSSTSGWSASFNQATS